MVNKNINSGSISTGTGNVQVGDNYYVSVMDGLAVLLAEYRQQLDKIEQLIDQFKVTTALGLLEDLERRVGTSNLPQQDIILSKLFYLKALCKRESADFSHADAAADFIQAYKRNTNDTNLRDRACVEYLNLNEGGKAEAMADQILAIDEYNRTAWYVKAINATDLKAFLGTIPRIVFEEYNFQMTMVSHVTATYNLHFLEDLDEFSLRADIAFEKYAELKFSALEAWRQAIDLAINNFFNKFPLRYIHGEKFLYKDHAFIGPVFKLLESYVIPLQDTEISRSINHQRFFCGYFGYLMTNALEFLKMVETTYPQISDGGWAFTFCYCQLLNHQKEYDKSLKLIEAYLQDGKESHSEAFLMQSALFMLTGNEHLIPDVFTSYLASVELIEERNGFNILNAFLRVLAGKVDESLVSSMIDVINQKAFKNEELKSLLNITLTVRYLQNYDKQDIYNRIVDLMEFEGFDSNWKNLIAEVLTALDRRSEALHFMDTYVDKSTISESLRLYINFLHDQLTDKYAEGDSRAEELLKLLEFWRLNSTYDIKEFMLYEHNLYQELNDLEKLEEIDEKLHLLYPEDEQLLLIYLNVLERGGKLEKISEVASSVKYDFENEMFGVNVSIILIRSKADAGKGFDILSRLAADRNNTIARRNYFALSLTMGHAFVSYETVSKGNWVTYSADDTLETVRIEKETGIHKELLGKKAGEVFSITSGISKKQVEIRVIEILNDAFHLLRDIQAEMQNPANDLGFESIKIPSDPKEMQEFMKAMFGKQGSEEKRHVEKALENYFNRRTGFTEITAAVFKKSYIDAYLNLTGLVGNKFTTLPGPITKTVDHRDPDTVFALDFSTVLLFYFLEKNMDFKFKHRFAISFHIKNEIIRELVELQAFPASEMTVKITEQSITRYDIPDDYYQRRREFLLSLQEWIEANCEVDLVPEKLNLLPKFKDGDHLDEFFKIMVDYMCLCDRPKCQVISSDLSLFQFTRRNNSIGNIIGPEKYLLAFYPEKCDSSFYRYLLENNYLGIGISLDTLKNEYFNLLAGSQTYYYFCLENLQFAIHLNKGIIEVIAKFLKEMYLTKSLTVEIKNGYAQKMLSYAVIGMPKDVVIALGAKLQQEFMLLGSLSEELRKIFISLFKR
ncbi:hypothetical protein D3C87_405820 [compost metagenome]